MSSGENQLRLLVPVNVEALVVGATADRTEWVDLKPDFRKVYFNRFLGRDLMVEPCSSTVPDLYGKPGVYLHWALPDGLTHGAAGADGAGPDFPLIPNRWLVVRLWEKDGDVGGSDLQFRAKYKAWIVESDTVTDEESGAVWPMLQAEHPGPGKEQDYSIRVGRRFELAHWPGETATPGADITAVGYGDPVFAASYPACKGILGFHDDDISSLQGVNLTYFVAGWYSDPSRDPLHRALTEATVEKLEEFLGEKKWTYPGLAESLEKAASAREEEEELKEARDMAVRLQKANQRVGAGGPAGVQGLQNEFLRGEAALNERIAELENRRQTALRDVESLQEQGLPGGILCHGIIAGIQWKDAETLYDSGVPRGRPFSIAIGNTAVEALTALFKLDGRLARLIEAFQYDLLAELETPGGDATAERKIHERTFRPMVRGIRWDLVQEGPIQADAREEKSPPIPGDIRALLESLNSRQRTINRLKRERDSLRSELYTLWYKQVLNSREERVSAEALTRQILDVRKSIEALSLEIAGLEDETAGRPKGDEWNQLREKLETFLPDWSLRQLDEPRFWRPNDPVVLLAGKAFERSLRHDHDGRYRSDDRLLCRLSGQEITELRLTIPYAKRDVVTFGPEDIDRWCSPLAGPAASPLPPEIANLIRESLFLTMDRERSRDIAAAAYEKNEPGLAQDHPDEVDTFARGLLDKYMKKVWEDAANPDLVDPDLRYEEGGSVWEFVGRFPSPIVLNQWNKNPWIPLFLQWQGTWSPAYADAVRAMEQWTLDDQGTAFTFHGVPPEEGGEQVYNGTTLLTPSAALAFSDRLRRYNLTHDDPKLREFQTAVSSLNVLCQSLGGLIDNLLMRTALLELRPLDPGSSGTGPLLSPVYDEVKDIDWLAPLTDNAFLPLRAGHFRLEKLWVIDAFGQVLKLEQESRDTINAPIVPDGLAGPDGSVRLEPRLAQPARLTIQWPPARQWDAPGEIDAPLGTAEEFNPVCGWIMPNFLDRGLMIYDARGYALGGLQAVQRKSWDRGVGAQWGEIESFHWIDVPGSEGFFFGRPPSKVLDPLGERANPHLRAFVNGLLSLTEDSGPAFSRLLENMNEALTAAGGPGSSQNPNLALLIGKPLALVRATIRLELSGGAARSPAWDAQGDGTGGIEETAFPLRLGDRWEWNGLWIGDDGLIGFFLDRNYSRFFPAFGLTGRDNSYIEHGKVPAISVAKALDLTLLMDPSRGVCATTGIVPRKIFQLPYGDVAETLENKEVIFFTGPLVSTATEVRMPQPADIYGQWSWTHHPEVKVWREEPITDYQKEQGRFFDNSLQIAEGWLKLMTAPLAIRSLIVKGKKPVQEEKKPEKEGGTPVPARYAVSPGETIILSWVVSGAETIELRQGTTFLIRSDRHPLPTQYRVQVNEDTSFTLIVAGREKQTTDGKAQQTTTEKTIAIAVVTERG